MVLDDNIYIYTPVLISEDAKEKEECCYTPNVVQSPFVYGKVKADMRRNNIRLHKEQHARNNIMNTTIAKHASTVKDLKPANGLDIEIENHCPAGPATDCQNLSKKSIVRSFFVLKGRIRTRIASARLDQSKLAV